VEEVQRVRLERARDLLENSRLSVSQVSEKCGFAEPAQLSRAIKAATGLTPTQFRGHALRERAGR
jgi:transcriptional regulator GlxA family with amidase domain